MPSLRYDAVGMAQIRIVDDWLRSPASPPSHFRSVMVIAEKWAEQRVLMRAYAESRDQLRPTIMLHGVELAIGPAGTDVNGPWGIHVGDNPDDRSAEIKHHFESAARRLAGSKGNPPRLADEESTFEREPTANWGPGGPRILPQRPHNVPTPVDFLSPQQNAATRVPSHQPATFVPQAPSPQHGAAANAPDATPPSNPATRLAPVPRPRGSRTRPPPSMVPSAGRGTALGYTSGAGAQSAIVRLGLAPQVSARLGRMIDKVVPADFHIDAGERRVLNALGGADLMSARAIGNLLDLTDAVTFMEELVKKLEAYGIDLVEPGEPHGGEPTYRLRR
jgi:hypothetical protein